jgi:hypothetical protein
MRSGRAEKTQFGERGLAGADQNDNTRGRIEEQGKETHRAISARPLTSNIFYMIVRNRNQKRKISYQVVTSK